MLIFKVSFSRQLPDSSQTTPRQLPDSSQTILPPLMTGPEVQIFLKSRFIRHWSKMSSKFNSGIQIYSSSSSKINPEIQIYSSHVPHAPMQPCPRAPLPPVPCYPAPCPLALLAPSAALSSSQQVQFTSWLFCFNDKACCFYDKTFFSLY